MWSGSSLRLAVARDAIKDATTTNPSVPNASIVISSPMVISKAVNLVIYLGEGEDLSIKINGILKNTVIILGNSGV